MSRKQPFPRQALVLAAGLGTRLRPLSELVPKPLMPLWGKPLLGHALDRLRAWGVRDVVINTHHLAGQVEQWVRERPCDGLRVRLSHETEILGTGGALVKARALLRDEPFWVVNADVAMALDPAPLVAAFNRRRPVAAVWLHPALGPRTVTVADGRITAFRAARGSGLTFCGLQLVSPAVFAYLPAAGAADSIAAYERAQADGAEVAGVTAGPCFWADLGTPEAMIAAHRDVLAAYRAGAAGADLLDPALPRRAAAAARRGVRVRGFAAIGSGVRLAGGCRLQDAVLWDQVTVGSRGALTQGIAATGVALHGPLSGVTLPAADGLRPVECEALALLRWPVDRTAVVPLPPRGSARTFHRLRGPDGRRAMLVRYSCERPENALYAGHARFLRACGIRVPGVLHDDPSAAFSVFEDLGDRTLERAARDATPAGRETLYAPVIDLLLRLHGEAWSRARREGLRMMDPFSPALYAWEHGLFMTHTLPRFVPKRSKRFRAIRDELVGLPSRFAAAPATLLHRDLQAGNILLTRSGPAMIDFQGMRAGPHGYDLASLLYDPYVVPDAALREAMLERYLAGAGRLAASVRRTFAPLAVQRLVQALGAYGRLADEAGRTEFLAVIPVARRLLALAAVAAGGVPALCEWAAEAG